MDEKYYTVKEIAEEINKENISPELTGLAEDIKRSREGKTGDEVACRLCGGIYKQPVWHFYGLCDGCCDEFKAQIYGVYQYSDGTTGIIGSSDWVNFKKNNLDLTMSVPDRLRIFTNRPIIYNKISCTCTHHIKEENK